MKGFLNRALVASGAAAAVAASSSFAFAEDGYGTPPSSTAPQSTPSARPGAPQIIIQQPPRDVATYTERSPNRALIGSGLAMFGLSYGGSLVVAATSDRPSDQHLYIPVAGPWIDLTHRDAGLGQRAGDASVRGPLNNINETANKVLLVTDGIFQAAGAAQIVAGFLFPETRTVTRTLGVHITPTGGKGAVGLAAYGSF